MNIFFITKTKMNMIRMGAVRINIVPQYAPSNPDILAERLNDALDQNLFFVILDVNCSTIHFAAG